MKLTPAPGRPVIISQHLCQPVIKDRGYAWLAGATLAPGSSPATLELFLSPDQCGTDTLPLSEWALQETWSESCSAWPALWDAQFIVLRATATGFFSATVLVDEIMPADSECLPLSGWMP
jgi:hypothetical protein